MRDFEYDVEKSTSNLNKHGIDFGAAQALWSDLDLIEVQVRSEGELRYLVVASIENKCWSAVITYRGASIRIISARRSRKKEMELYES